jgi:hypothetical protein
VVTLSTGPLYYHLHEYMPTKLGFNGANVKNFAQSAGWGSYNLLVGRSVSSRLWLCEDVWFSGCEPSCKLNGGDSKSRIVRC